MQSVPQGLSFCRAGRRLACVVAFWLCGNLVAPAQIILGMNLGPDAGFSQVDMAQIYLDTQAKQVKKIEQLKAQDKERVDSGVISALDLEAPNNAVEEFNRASTLLKAQNSKEAMKHLQKAIEDYPKFVSAHVGLGLAYVDQEDPSHAKSEFEEAAKLDDKFPGSFRHLGQLALQLNDFATAESALQRAAALSPRDARILSALAYAQNGTHEYEHVLETAQRVHALDHKGMANVHYVAAAAAMALKDYETMEHELGFFLGEDPTNAFAPVARQNLAALAHNKEVRAGVGAHAQAVTTVSVSQPLKTFPNSDRLKAQLNTLGDEFDAGNCGDCNALAAADSPKRSVADGAASNVPDGPVGRIGGVWTIRKSVDDVALFFSVSNHGHMIDDLEASNIQIRDDNQAPERVVQFAPQSKLPLRLALLVDVSGSVHDRFSFEKAAATKFVQKVLSNPSDLGFIAGFFATEPTVTKDFSSESNRAGKRNSQTHQRRRNRRSSTR